MEITIDQARILALAVSGILISDQRFDNDEIVELHKLYRQLEEHKRK